MKPNRTTVPSAVPSPAPTGGTDTPSGATDRTRALLEIWRRFRRNRAALFGLMVLLLFGLCAIFAPWITPGDPFEISDHAFSSPGAGAWFGTTDLGRDVLTGVVHGARVSMLVGVLAALASAVTGAVIGAIAGYYGGSVDAVLMRITEMFQVLPRFFLALVIVALFGGGFGQIVFVIAVLSWPPTARLVRGQFLSLRQQEFVAAAKVLGFSTRHIIFSEVLPNALPPVIVLGSLDAAQAILLEANLGFFGLSDPALISWGQMLNDAQRFLQQAWWMSAFPGLAIFLTVLGFNLFGDGLNDALNPRLKER